MIIATQLHSDFKSSSELAVEYRIDSKLRTTTFDDVAQD